MLCGGRCFGPFIRYDYSVDFFSGIQLISDRIEISIVFPNISDGIFSFRGVSKRVEKQHVVRSEYQFDISFYLLYTYILNYSDKRARAIPRYVLVMRDYQFQYDLYAKYLNKRDYENRLSYLRYIIRTCVNYTHEAFQGTF